MIWTIIILVTSLLWFDKYYKVKILEKRTDFVSKNEYINNFIPIYIESEKSLLYFETTKDSKLDEFINELKRYSKFKSLNIIDYSEIDSADLSKVYSIIIKDISLLSDELLKDLDAKLRRAQKSKSKFGGVKILIFDDLSKHKLEPGYIVSNTNLWKDIYFLNLNTSDKRSITEIIKEIKDPNELTEEVTLLKSDIIDFYFKNDFKNLSSALSRHYRNKEANGILPTKKIYEILTKGKPKNIDWIKNNLIDNKVISWEKYLHYNGVPGVYKITILSNDNEVSTYIGESKDLIQRIAFHYSNAFESHRPLDKTIAVTKKLMNCKKFKFEVITTKNWYIGKFIEQEDWDKMIWIKKYALIKKFLRLEENNQIKSFKEEMENMNLQ